MGKLTIYETSLPSLWQASPFPRPPLLPLFLASQACGASPTVPDLPGWAWGAHLPPRFTSSPARLWGLGSGTTKQQPSLSAARTPPRRTPRMCPTPSFPAWPSWLSGEVVTELPRLGPGVGPSLKGYTPFLTPLCPTPEGVVEAGISPNPTLLAPQGLTEPTRWRKEGKGLSPALLTQVTGSSVSGAPNRQVQ